MLEKLKKLNPEIELYDVSGKEFATFGRIITSLDATEIIETAKKIANPDTGSSYLPTCEDFEILDIANKIENECFGTLPTQIGYCWGHNNFLNATEWHTSSEINIAVTPLVLILGHIWDIKDDKIDSSKFKAFYVPKGTVIDHNVLDTLRPIFKDGYGVREAIINAIVHNQWTTENPPKLI